MGVRGSIQTWRFGCQWPLVGGAINAAVASALTTAFGEAYIAALYILTKNNPDHIPVAEEVRDEFMRQLQTTKFTTTGGLWERIKRFFRRQPDVLYQ